jgi:hypothetical protein
MAINERGTVALAWGLSLGAQVSSSRTDGSWTEPVTIRSAVHYSPNVQVTVDGVGRILAMWGRDAQIDALAKKHLAWAVVDSAGDLSGQGLLATGTERDVFGTFPDLSINPRGQVLAAWSLDSRTRGGPYGARYGFETGWQPPRRLMPGHDCCPVAFMPDAGNPVAVMNRFYIRRPP